ncbi:MAG: HTH domain-containing protein [Phycisphaerae bacterium]|nr:HTH domain-containing protein [Phycisphaerae bacterium]
MLYERSLEIERRLEAVLGMIRKGSYSTPRMAEELGVSIPTVSRDVTALRQRGHDIRAERGENGWRYVLQESKRKSVRKTNAAPRSASPGANDA